MGPAGAFTVTGSVTGTYTNTTGILNMTSTGVAATGAVTATSVVAARQRMRQPKGSK